MKELLEKLRAQLQASCDRYDAALDRLANCPSGHAQALSQVQTALGELHQESLVCTQLTQLVSFHEHRAKQQAVAS